jgi:molybdopterin-synthase adenylyltransferase
MLKYHELIQRNIGYVSGELQQKIRDTRVLVAGCGIGSSFAESAVRVGFERITIADGDTVGAHNLNRQNFTAADIGRYKVDALSDRLLAINPAADVHKIALNLDSSNITEAVEGVDVVFDTIDFLDLPAIVGLHDECRRQGKPAVTALAIGWGAGCMYFPPRGEWSFRRVFGIADDEAISGVSYKTAFSSLLDRLVECLDPQVARVVTATLAVMEDGAPCPAAQVAPGALTVAALATTLLVEVLAGRPVTPAPGLLVVDLPAALRAPGIDLSR